MMVTFAMTFAAPIDFDRLRITLEQRLLRFPRFRQRVIQSRDRLYWAEDPGFDLDGHLQRLRPPSPGDEAMLQGVVSDLMSAQLDFSRPLWEFHLVEGYASGCALVGRVHHGLADGVALMQVLRSLVDPELEEPPPFAGYPTEPLTDDIAIKIAELVARGGLEVLSNPRYLLSLVRMGTGAMAALRKMMLRTPDPDTVFRGRLGTAKRVAWSAPLALHEVKAAGRPVDGTVNDVMLAAATGALRRYMQRRGEPVAGVTLRAGLSVNLRSPDAEPSLGNRAGAVLVDLPVGLDTPLARLRETKRQMDGLKSSPEASVVWGLLNALGRASPEIQAVLVERYCSQHTAVIANVPGATETAYLVGAPLETLIFWVPAFGRVGLSLSISSYAGDVWFGVATDENLVPDPERIVSGFHAEFESLRSVGHRTVAGRAEPSSTMSSVEAMNAMLDEAIESLDAMLQEE
jgi:WS/DGAT/MGAT family acyltransferase